MKVYIFDFGYQLSEQPPVSTSLDKRRSTVRSSGVAEMSQMEFHKFLVILKSHDFVSISVLMGW